MCSQIRATFYDLNGNIGNCGYEEVPTMHLPAMVLDRWAAANTFTYRAGASCGECWEIAGPKGNTTVMVTDQCPAATNQEWCAGQDVHLDLGRPAFAAIEDEVRGVTWLSARPVPCPFADSIKVFVRPGSNPYWAALVIVAHKVGLASVEVKPRNATTWSMLTREEWNGWIVSTGNAVPGLQVRLTSTLGEVLEPSVEIPTTENTVTDTGLQFSQLGPAPAGMCSCTASECNYY